MRDPGLTISHARHGLLNGTPWTLLSVFRICILGTNCCRLQYLDGAACWTVTQVSVSVALPAPPELPIARTCRLVAPTISTPTRARRISTLLRYIGRPLPIYFTCHCPQPGQAALTSTFVGELQMASLYRAALRGNLLFIHDHAIVQSHFKWGSTCRASSLYKFAITGGASLAIAGLINR